MPRIRQSQRPPSANADAAAIFRRAGGVLRTHEALDLGIHPRTLYALRDDGTLERLSRGLYRLAELPPPADPDLLTIAKRVPDGVLCLISALSQHDLTTQIPHEVHLALPEGHAEPTIAEVPLRTYRFGGASYTAGIESFDVGGAELKIYDPEKTLADVFKFRNQIGLDVALEALEFYRERRPLRIDRLLRYAGICRVRNVMRPYLEAMLR